MQGNQLIALFISILLLIAIIGWLVYLWYRHHVRIGIIISQAKTRVIRERRANKDVERGHHDSENLVPKYTAGGWMRPKPRQANNPPREPEYVVLRRLQRDSNHYRAYSYRHGRLSLLDVAPPQDNQEAQKPTQKQMRGKNQKKTKGKNSAEGKQSTKQEKKCRQGTPQQAEKLPQDNNGQGDQKAGKDQNKNAEPSQKDNPQNDSWADVEPASGHEITDTWGNDRKSASQHSQNGQEITDTWGNITTWNEQKSASQKSQDGQEHSDGPKKQDSWASPDSKQNKDDKGTKCTKSRKHGSRPEHSERGKNNNSPLGWNHDSKPSPHNRRSAASEKQDKRSSNKGSFKGNKQSNRDQGRGSRRYGGSWSQGQQDHGTSWGQPSSSSSSQRGEDDPANAQGDQWQTNAASWRSQASW